MPGAQARVTSSQWAGRGFESLPGHLGPVAQSGRAATYLHRLRSRASLWPWLPPGEGEESEQVQHRTSTRRDLSGPRRGHAVHGHPRGRRRLRARHEVRAFPARHQPTWSASTPSTSPRTPATPRYAELVRRSTLDDPGWTARFLRWLRTDANLRTASLVGAAEFAKARRDAGLDGLSRQVVAGVLQRADEPGELLAYWTSVHGRAVPKPVKRGVADAAARLYDERSFVKWDSASARVPVRRRPRADPPGAARRRGRASCSSTFSTSGTPAATRSRTS